jgi:hypothetical protein
MGRSGDSHSEYPSIPVFQRGKNSALQGAKSYAGLAIQGARNSVGLLLRRGKNSVCSLLGEGKNSVGVPDAIDACDVPRL